MILQGPAVLHTGFRQPGQIIAKYTQLLRSFPWESDDFIVFHDTGYAVRKFVAQFLGSYGNQPGHNQNDNQETQDNSNHPDLDGIAQFGNG